MARRALFTPRAFSVLHRPPPLYEGHIPLTRAERLTLTLSAAVLALRSPRRADLVASLTETSAPLSHLRRLRDAMLLSPSGRAILRARPALTPKSLHLPTLRQLPRNTFGHTYVSWLDAQGVSPFTRARVRFVDDAECAFVLQRYRDCHDFYHALAGLPVSTEGEVALKAWEWACVGLPVAALSLGALGRVGAGGRRRFVGEVLPWVRGSVVGGGELLSVYWEREMESDVDELRVRLGVQKAPDLRALRRREREREREGV